MDWVKQLNIAIRYIEDHLTGTIEYDELAKMLCCSTYQFQRMFAFMNNVPLSEYIRRRKLSLAVADIQKGERVIDVALKYGYSSPTAFSRAFQCLHGITPSEARKKGTLLKTYYEDFIFNWIAADHIYKKRASFVLIAASTIHDKSMTKETLDIYLKLVYENSCYEHDHIKKAVSWALREIGKTDFEYAEKVLLTAYDLLASGNKVQIWIAKDVIKELETVVKVKERKRLITSNSKMGRER